MSRHYRSVSLKDCVRGGEEMNKYGQTWFYLKCDPIMFKDVKVVKSFETVKKKQTKKPHNIKQTTAVSRYVLDPLVHSQHLKKTGFIFLTITAS